MARDARRESGVFYCPYDVTWTSNFTEEAIGRMKMRSRTMRGYKTRCGMLHGLWAAT